MNFNEALEYCKINKCNAFAINEEKYEVFVIQLHHYDESVIEDEEDEYLLFFSRDDVPGMNGDENCAGGIDDSFEIADAIKEFPYLNNLVWCAISTKITGWDGLNFYGQKEFFKKIN